MTNPPGPANPGSRPSLRLIEQRSWKIKGELEPGPCNFCGSDRLIFYREENSFRIERCRDCGLIQVNPRPRSEELSGFYAQYFPENSAEEWLRVYRDQYQEDAELIERGCRGCGKKIFEVGAGYGFFLAEMTRRGWEAEGVDLSRPAVEYARERLGIEIQLGDFPATAVPEGKYDALAGSFVLEHIRDPAGMLKMMREMLNPGGILILRLPNHSLLKIYGWLGTAAELLPVGFLLRRIRAGTDPETVFNVLDPPAHLYGFTPGVLKEYLEKIGFVRVRVFNGRMHRRGTRINWLFDGLVYYMVEIIYLLSAGKVALAPALRVRAFKGG